MDFTSYIMDKALILIPFLWVLGYIIKQSLINNKYIPLILLVIAVAISNAMLGLSVESTIQGVLVAGATILADQLPRQLGKDN